MLKPATLTVSPALAEEDDLEAEELPEVGEELVPASPSQPVHESGSTDSAALETREAAGRRRCLGWRQAACRAPFVRVPATGAPGQT